VGTDFLRIAVASAESAIGAPAEVPAVVAALRASGYRSRFHNWESTATVRNRPLRTLGPQAPDTLYFPPELVAVHAHPAVAALGAPAGRRLLVHALHQYLHFTTELEDLTVIPVAMDLSRDRCGLRLPAEARRDAHRIVTDEAWHAQFSDELGRQIERETGEPMPARRPMFVERLELVAGRLRTNVPSLGRLLFAVVSETLVSSLLAEIPHDTRLPPAVRETVADHAFDEGRHHAYFREILAHLWAALSRAERAAVGPWLPTMILAFLEPDYRAVADSLAALGLEAEQIEAVLRESYPRPVVLAGAAAAAQPTIRYFAEVGAMDDPATADAFAVLTSA
jgi:hypothetical protein